MKIKLPLLIGIAGLVLASSCASYKKNQYAGNSDEWKNSGPDQKAKLTHTMYLVGNAGNDSPDKKAPVLQYLKTKLPTESKNSSILFLGDNIYEKGMPPREDSVERKEAEYRINSELQTLDDFQGRPIFLPGNHDWKGWGLKGLKREENYIENYLNNRRGKTDKDDFENYFLPDDGCSGPEVVELNDQLVVLVVDSQWWLTDWDKEPTINDGCDVKNRETFKFVFENLVRKYKNKNVVIALHHPPYTYGEHGGNFTVRQHIFPLTDINKNLYVPLPVIGSLAALFRSSIGGKQDVSNQYYKNLKAGMMAGVRKNGSFIFASGHENAMELIENERQEFIVSGSGSKTGPVRLGKGSKFASTALGYSTLSFYEGGETWVQFWQVSDDGSKSEMVFQKKIKDKLPVPKQDIQPVYTEYEHHKDSLDKPIFAKEVKKVNHAHNFFFGAHNRALYQEKYPFPVLDLATYKGGLTPVKQGGGNQTNSLRVKDPTGKEYVLRGMTKDVSRLLPFPFNQMTAAKYVAEDNFLSTHPFAPLAIPPLADAINVYHTNPKLFYVPNQPALGVFNSIFGGSMSLFEERPDGKKWKNDAFFGNADKIIGTPDLMENILKDGKYKVDEEWALRTRLLDFLLGDWDRHDDQWTWSSTKKEDGTQLYRPIPRDRDQAFSRYDGLFTNMAKLTTMPFLRQLQTYQPEIKSMKWTSWSARLFDRTFLTELSWEQWENQVKFIQANLTDQVIEGAFASWPEKARQLSAPFIIKSLKARRDNLMTLAKEHYAFIGKSVDILGTEKRERFDIERIDNEHTRVTVHEINKKGEEKGLHYDRIFDNKITRSINIYGNGNDDQFVTKGSSHKGIKVRLIGGTGKDSFADSSQVESGLRKTVIYDDLSDNNVIEGEETNDKRTGLYRYNIYDRRGTGSDYNINMPIPIVGYNPDDGFLIGGNLTMIRYGFKKEPYASLQRFGGSFSFGTKALKLNYTGDFINAFKIFDFYLDAFYHGPAYAFNYAGLGNESQRPVSDPNFYRVRQKAIHIYPSIKKRFGNNGFVTLGPILDISKIQQTAGRYITVADGDLNKDDIFNTKYFSGGKATFDFNNVDNIYSPHSGIRFHTDLSWVKNLKENKNFTGLRAQLALYKSLDKKERFVVASQVGTGVNFGSGYEFFQLPTLGGNQDGQGLRGYRTQRFYGKSSLWHSTDMRVKINSSYNKTLPFTFGVFGGFDYGRVWLTEYPSEKWHYDYGGGLWFAPVDIVTISVGAFFPKEKKEESPLIMFRMGFWF
ncbi:metallophosphoesterase [Dyadobacter sp. CY356]|uniref:metallophosphoesterase n=1 Tax=Dyadobacter sp. CY356 TaxID=2906442 RepID=UPI001F2EF580|nr:metallophosphoesterase [Dyadobacter sp. CY356]MCF0055968.1 metallophosphoesterase [Dyadobacter sp. CY356]